MNGDDEIQARREERAKWAAELTAAREAYEEAVTRQHDPGRVMDLINYMRSCHERIMDAKFKVDWLRWCDEMDEGRYREEASDGSV